MPPIPLYYLAAVSVPFLYNYFENVFQALLCEPDLDSACILNQQAAYHYVHARHTYNQLVYDCVTASLRIQGNNDHDSLHQVNTVCVTC